MPSFTDQGPRLGNSRRSRKEVPCLDAAQPTNSTKETYRKASPKWPRLSPYNFARNPNHLLSCGYLRHPRIFQHAPNPRSAPRQIASTELFEQSRTTKSSTTARTMA
jgi:hypothetical protein